MRALAALLAMALLVAFPVQAQNANAPAAEKQATLDRLLGALKSAPSEEIAGPLEQQIRQLWLNAGSPAVTLLISRGLRGMKAGSLKEAIEDFTAAITLDPNLPEAYHQRAIARYADGDTAGAVADIEATLRLEPRSFAALATLAGIAEAGKNWKGAYEAWRKVLEIDPKMPGGQDRLKDLRRHALGEEA